MSATKDQRILIAGNDDPTTEFGVLSPLKTAALNAHSRGLHEARGDLHCPRCQALGYVGAGYDQERLNYGGTP